MNAAAVHGAVAVRKRNTPEAVLMSMGEYEALVANVPDSLESLRREFDDLVEKMQSPKSRSAADALFTSTSDELGRVAVKAARRSRG